MKLVALRLKMEADVTRFFLVVLISRVYGSAVASSQNSHDIDAEVIADMALGLIVIKDNFSIYSSKLERQNLPTSIRDDLFTLDARLGEALALYKEALGHYHDHEAMIAKVILGPNKIRVARFKFLLVRKKLRRERVRTPGTASPITEALQALSQGLRKTA